MTVSGAKACLIVPLEARLSPLGCLDSSLTFVLSLQSLFGGQGKASPSQSLVQALGFYSGCGGAGIWVPVNTEQKLSNILFLFDGGNSPLLERAKGIGKLSLEFWEMSRPKTGKESRLQRGRGGVEAKEKAAIGWVVFKSPQILSGLGSHTTLVGFCANPWIER